MPLRYSSTTIGTFTLVQQREDEEKPRKYKIQIRQGNCLAVFMNIYKEENPKDPKRPWVHDLVCFFVDEAHIKRCMREYKTNFWYSVLCGKLERIRLNMYYKENKILLKYFVKDGYNVQCYYKEPKK